MYINGEFVESKSGNTFEVFNPATEEVIAVVTKGTAEDARTAIDYAEQAQLAWEKLPAIERAGYLRKIASGIRERSEEIARTISAEMGKVLPLARVEVNFTADYMDYMAEWARRYEGEIVQSDRPNEHIFIYKKPIGVTTGILLLGKYRLLDSLSKIIMIALTVTTVSAVVIALMRNGIHGVAAPDFVAPSPWELSKLAFLVALMGWMPAPIEISAINSMWVVAKRRLTKVSYQDGLFDFNVGYIGTAILAVVFLALGALVQFGSPETVEMVGGKYIAQLINMYASTIGEWARLLIAVIAFMCMFGTTITVIDGYSRSNVESLRLLLGKHESTVKTLNIAMVLAAVSGLAIIFYFNNAVGPMLKFAMIASFVSAPVFAWLNLSLTMKAKHSVKGGLLWLSFIGLFYLTAFAALFIAQQAGWLG